MSNKVLKLKSSKTFTKFRPLILSRHPSHDILRMKPKQLPALPCKSVVRFGSSTKVEDLMVDNDKRIEVNSVEAIKNSANKLLMKQKFVEAGVKTAEWVQLNTNSYLQDVLTLSNNWETPIVAKSYFGSKGKGNTLIKNQAEFNAWNNSKQHNNYIFEKFVNYALEYRLHITSDGCFYTCRKALKKDVPEDQKWRRHDDICVWFLEENENFLKPNSWNDIVRDCVRALNTVGADLLSFDVRVQGATDGKGNRRNYQEYILLECNSASSMNNGTDQISVCAQKYIEEIPKIILKKLKNELI